MRSDLLEYYERELSFLRQMGAEFADKYPKVASRLQLEPDKCEDPHVETASRGVRVPRGARAPQDRRRIPGDHGIPPRNPLPDIPRARALDVRGPVRPERGSGEPADGPDDSQGIDARVRTRRRDPVPLPDRVPGHDLADRGARGPIRAGTGGHDRRPRRADDASPRPARPGGRRPFRAQGEDRRGRRAAALAAPVLPAGRRRRSSMRSTKRCSTTRSPSSCGPQASSPDSEAVRLGPEALRPVGFARRRDAPADAGSPLPGISRRPGVLHVSGEVPVRRPRRARAAPRGAAFADHARRADPAGAAVRRRTERLGADVPSARDAGRQPLLAARRADPCDAPHP